MADSPSILLTFIAGFLSFFSPCVLPLIPSFLGLIGSAGGVAVSASVSAALPADATQIENENKGKKRFILLITTICFILGFTIVFIVFSIIVSTTFLLMGGISKYIQMAAGIIVIILGLNILFDFLKFLNYEKRIQTSKNPKGLIGAFLMGAAFGAGWTPCIGPILAGVLFLAGQSGKTSLAVFYLLIYSLGLGIPFMLTAIFFDRYLVPAKWFRNKLPIIKRISAIVLIFMGVLILTGSLSSLSIVMQRWQFQYIEWAEGKGLFFELIASWLKMIHM